MKIKIICILILFLLFPIFLFAQDIWGRPLSKEERNKIIEMTLRKFDQEEHSVDIDSRMNVNPEERNRVIEKTLRKITIEVTLEYVFATHGEQIFELLDSQGGLASKLTYPTKGEMLIFKGEVGFLSKFFLGGRYGSSDFKKTVCSDEDWNIYDPTWPPYGTDDYVDYQITKQDCKSKVELFDVNLYYRFLDFDEEEVRQRRLSFGRDTIFDFLLVDSLSLDIFIGYQQQKGRYRMIDPFREWLFYDEGAWYYLTGLPADFGLDSFYKIEYKGPRLGLRAKGSKGKVTTKVWFAYAWLKTEAYGWWNIRNLTYWQTGRNGSGIDTGFEVTYAFTPALSAGMGFNYLKCWQKKLKMYAVENGTPWWEGYQDRIRNADSEIYGPSFILKFIW